MQWLKLTRQITQLVVAENNTCQFWCSTTHINFYLFSCHTGQATQNMYCMSHRKCTVKNTKFLFRLKRQTDLLLGCISVVILNSIIKLLFPQQGSIYISIITKDWWFLSGLSSRTRIWTDLLYWSVLEFIFIDFMLEKCMAVYRKQTVGHLTYVMQWLVFHRVTFSVFTHI